MNDHAMSAININKTIKGRQVISSMSFDVYRGDVFGFLGPNGSGKTMTIRILTGLVHPTKGNVFIFGFNVQEQFVMAMRHVGATVDYPCFHNYLTGYQNLELLARMTGDFDKKHIGELVELVGMTSRINTKVGTYSAGMKQRLGLAHSLLHRPKLVIFDEPTSNLDLQGIKDIREMIRHLSDKHKVTVFVSTHILSEVEKLCNRVVIINAGSVIKQGAVKELLSDSGYETLELSVSHSEIAFQKLNECSLVHEIKVEDEKLIIKIESGDSGKINKLLMESAIEVYTITPRKFSLEDYYMQISRGENIE